MLLHKRVTSILNKHKKRDTLFIDDYSVNPYLGCSCNCQYCYIRGKQVRREHGADSILIGGLTLFGEGPADSKTRYLKFIERNFPHLIYTYHQLFGEEFSEPLWYQQQLQERILRLCKSHKIRNSIIENEERKIS